MVDVETGLRITLIVISACELIVLFYAYQNRFVKWESMWVIFVELFQYAATVVVPDSEFVTFQLTNGIKLPWLQYMSWVATVPVLLMYLVSLTAHGGRSATVPLVPLLVSGLMMLLLGITAAACSPPLKWFAFGVACCFGGMVFASVAQCFRALYLIVPAYAYAKGAARCLVGGMGLAFVGGWLLFPLMFALGHLGADLISRDLEAIGQFFGDLLAKNTFVALGCVVKGQYLRSPPRLAAGAMITSPANPGRFPQGGAEDNDAMQSAQELIFDDLSFRGRARRATPAEQHASELRHAAAYAAGAASATPAQLLEYVASPSRFQELRAKSEAGSSASGCRLMEVPAHSGAQQRAAQQPCEHAANTLRPITLHHDALEPRPLRSASCRHNGAQHSTPGTRPARPEEASIDGVGVNSQELLSALRLIAANPSVASALPPLERTTADRPRDLHV